MLFSGPGKGVVWQAVEPVGIYHGSKQVAGYVPQAVGLRCLIGVFRSAVIRSPAAFRFELDRDIACRETLRAPNLVVSLNHIELQ